MSKPFFETSGMPLLNYWAVVFSLCIVALVPFDLQSSCFSWADFSKLLFLRMKLWADDGFSFPGLSLRELPKLYRVESALDLRISMFCLVPDFSYFEATCGVLTSLS